MEDWESVRDQPIFTVPELQCNKFKEAYKLLNATHQTQWRRYLIDQCLIGGLVLLSRYTCLRCTVTPTPPLPHPCPTLRSPVPRSAHYIDTLLLQ